MSKKNSLHEQALWEKEEKLKRMQKLGSEMLKDAYRMFLLFSSKYFLKKNRKIYFEKKWKKMENFQDPAGSDRASGTREIRDATGTN